MSLVLRKMSIQSYPLTHSKRTCTDGVLQLQDTNDAQEDLSETIRNNAIHMNTEEDNKIDQFANGDITNRLKETGLQLKCWKS